MRSMQLGMFTMPSHPPERPLYDALQWDRQTLRWADEYGYTEAWIGEHFTAPWEPVPAPDLLIAQAALETQHIKLAPGAHLLPYHNPVELAHRVAQLDHMLQGRLILGVGAGGLPTDWEMFAVDGMNNENRFMAAEALEIMLRIWESTDRFEFRGKYWNANYVPDTQYGVFSPWLKPFQRPHPPIGIAGGLSSPSLTLEMAGERGFYPMTFALASHVVKSGWESVERGAERVGRTADRSQWRVVRDVFVADTDAEAIRWSVDSHMGRMQNQYFLKLLTEFGWRHVLKHDLSVPDDAVTPAYLAKTTWLVGSPETVAERLAEQYDDLGGFGTVLMSGYDYSEDPEPWRRSMELMAKEVMPRVAHLEAPVSV
jgi:alkanesulfonate monooxygenase SsuD/methylene tetrahydromethanopterin reductase-like flavin-dependent oxidoreductase (luciferase family)